MTRCSIPGPHGYDIPLVHTLTGGEKRVVLISHGFGSGKDSPTAQMLLRALPVRGFGAAAFDFPAHGDSPADGDCLTVDRCLDDLAAVEEHVCSLCPRAELMYFSSSFGAYLNLIYLSTRPHRGRRSFLRSAALEMPLLFRHPTPEQAAQLREKGFVILEEGYARPLKITRDFLASLDAHDVFRLFRPGQAQVAMVHGSDDSVASPEAARRFRERFGVELTVLQGGDHRLSIPGGPERVTALAEEFFSRGAD